MSPRSTSKSPRSPTATDLGATAMGSSMASSGKKALANSPFAGSGKKSGNLTASSSDQNNASMTALMGETNQTMNTTMTSKGNTTVSGGNTSISNTMSNFSSIIPKEKKSLILHALAECYLMDQNMKTFSVAQGLTLDELLDNGLLDESWARHGALREFFTEASLKKVEEVLKVKH